MEGMVIFKDGFVPSVLKLSWLTMTKLTCWPAASSQGKHHSRRKKKGEKRSQTLNLPIQTLSQSQAGRNSSFMYVSHTHLCHTHASMAQIVAFRALRVVPMGDGAFPCSPWISNAVGSCLAGGRMMILPHRRLMIL